MSPTDEKTHSYRIFACFSYIFLDPGLLFLLAGKLFALLPSGSVLCTTDVTPRTDFSRSSPHFLFWHQVFELPCLGPFTPVTHISYSSAAVIKHHDEKYPMGESVFQVTFPGGKPIMVEGLGIEHCGRCRKHRDHASVSNGKQRVNWKQNETKLSKVIPSGTHSSARLRLLKVP